jgi:hypothetical protein
MMSPSTPSIEMRSPGAQKPTINWGKGGLAGLGLISVPASNGSASIPGFFSGAPISPGAPSGANGSGGGGIAPTVAQPFTTTTAANPIFYDVNGNIITHAVCGSVYSMSVPGFEGQQLHIVQTKDGRPQFSGTMDIPMANYASKCLQDEGSYNLQAFTLSGQLLGSTNFVVLPAQPSQPATGPLSPAGLPPLPAATGTNAPAPGTTSATSPLPASVAPSVTAPPAAAASILTPGLSNLSTNDWLILAAFGIVMYMAGQGSKRR